MQSQIRLSGLRIMAMARPCKSRMEILLVRQAIEELKLAGSARARAKSLAQKVADLVVGQFAQDELIASLVRAEVGLGKPALAELAFGDDSAAGEIAQCLAVASFERRGCRHAPAIEWKVIDSELGAALALQLTERFRRSLK